MLKDETWIKCWQQFEKNIFYIKNITEIFQPILVYLDSCIISALQYWNNVLPRKIFQEDEINLHTAYSVPPFFSRSSLEKEPKQEKGKEKVKETNDEVSETIVQSSAVFQGPTKIISLPLKELENLIQLSLDYKTENILGAEKNIDEACLSQWKAWCIEKIIGKESPAFEVLIANFNLERLRDLITTTYGKTRIFATLYESLSGYKSFDAIKLFGKLGEAYQTLKVLKEYVLQFVTEKENISSLDHEAIFIDIIKDKALYQWLADEEKSIYRHHLIDLCNTLGVNGFNKKVARKTLKMFSDFQGLVQSYTEQHKITSYATLITYILHDNPAKTIKLFQSALNIILHLKQVIKVFLDPIINPLHLLAVPIVSTVLNQIQQQLNDKKNNDYIDIYQELAEYLRNNEAIGIIALTPIGKHLSEKHFDYLNFSALPPLLAQDESTDNNLIVCSFDTIRFSGFYFIQTTFKEMSFENALFYQCDFSKSSFFGTINVKNLTIDTKTAATFLDALACSVQNPEQNCKVVGQFILESEQDEIVPVPYCLRSYININLSTASVQITHTANYLPVFDNNNYIPRTSLSITEEMADFHEESRWTSEKIDVESAQEQGTGWWAALLGGLSEYLPSYEFMSTAMCESLENLSLYMQREKGVLSKLATFKNIQR